MLRSPLARCSSPDLRLNHLAASSHEPAPSPSQPRSNSFVSSRRCGIVSEQDVIRLAALDDDRRPAAPDPRPPPPRTAPVQTGPSPWPAPVLRQRSGGDPDQRQPRPLSTGYLPSNTAAAAAAAETQAALQRGVQGSAQVNGADTPVRLQNVALLPNRQLIQQPGTGGFLNFVLCSAMRCDKINAK